MPFRRENRRITVGLILIAAASFIIVIGAQAWLAQRENADQDRQDRAYAECLTAWADDVVDALETRTEANRELDTARDRKDKLLDRLIVISSQAQQYDAQDKSDLPPKLLERYERTLAARVDAQRDFDQLRANLVRVRARNPYVSPRVSCRR